MEPPNAEGVAVASRDHSVVSSLKERVSRRNLISQGARRRVPACLVLHVPITKYKLEPPLHTGLIFERFAAANAKALIFLDLVRLTYGSPQLRRSSVAIDALRHSCIVGADHKYVVVVTRTV